MPWGLDAGVPPSWGWRLSYDLIPSKHRLGRGVWSIALGGLCAASPWVACTPVPLGGLSAVQSIAPRGVPRVQGMPGLCRGLRFLPHRANPPAARSDPWGAACVTRAPGDPGSQRDRSRIAPALGPVRFFPEGFPLCGGTALAVSRSPRSAAFGFGASAYPLRRAGVYGRAPVPGCLVASRSLPYFTTMTERAPVAVSSRLSAPEAKTFLSELRDQAQEAALKAALRRFDALREQGAPVDPMLRR